MNKNYKNFISSKQEDPKVIEYQEALQQEKPLRYLSDFIFQVACVYVIHNPETDFYYIGQTLDARNRVYDHASDLRNYKHRNAALQNDYISLTQEFIDPFSVITFTPIDYDSINKKTPAELKVLAKQYQQAESDLIKEYTDSGKRLYNDIKHEKRIRPLNFKVSPVGKTSVNIMPCSINGEVFPSRLEAELILNCTPETILRWIRNPKKPECFDIPVEEIIDQLQPEINQNRKKTKKLKQVIGRNTKTSIRFNNPYTGKSIIFPSQVECVRGMQELYDSLTVSQKDE